MALWKGLALEEVNGKSSFPVTPSLDISDKKVNGLWEIIDALADLEGKKDDKTETFHQPSVESYKNVRSSSEDILKQLFAVKEQVVNSNGEEKDLKGVTEVLNQVSKEHLQLSFFKSQEITPVDLVIYEFYKMIEAIAPQNLSGEIIKYIERVEAQKFMREFNIEEKNFMRDFSPKVKSFSTRFLEIFGDKVTQLCDFAMMDGILYKTNISTTDKGDILVPTHTPLSLYPRKVAYFWCNAITQCLKVLKSDYELMTRVQDRWNIMLNEMARDFDWYKDKLKV